MSSHFWKGYILALSWVLLFSDSNAQLPVRVEQGELLGTALSGPNGLNIIRFYGVPYAAPPVGNLRWKPPQTPLPFSNGPFNASQPGPPCVQSGGFGKHSSEDCLSLNIWAPSRNLSQPLNATKTLLPVMMFIHGGSFVYGAGSLYNAYSLAARYGNVVAVTINYRMGIFGFLANQALLRESNTTGNYGIQDQRAAMMWLKRNIAQFGGDPSNITIFGESAGAISICHHLVSPLSAGLFSSAILESGFCEAHPLEQAFNATDKGFIGGINCTSQNNAEFLECARSRSPAELLAIQRQLNPPGVIASLLWTPVVDGYELDRLPQQYLGNGSFSRVPILIGTNRNEYSYFLCGSSTVNYTRDNVTALFTKLFGEQQLQGIMKHYPFDQYSSPIQMAIDVMSDVIFKCPSRFIADSFRDANVNTFMYSFDDVPGFSVIQGSCYGTSHADEVPFIFPLSLPLIAGAYQFTPAELALSIAMIDSWIQFASVRTPTNAAAAWVAYDAERSFTSLNLNITNENKFRTPICDFWAGENPESQEIHWAVWLIIAVGIASFVTALGYLVYDYFSSRGSYETLRE